MFGSLEDYENKAMEEKSLETVIEEIENLNNLIASEESAREEYKVHFDTTLKELKKLYLLESKKLQNLVLRLQEIILKYMNDERYAVANYPAYYSDERLLNIFHGVDSEASVDFAIEQHKLSASSLISISRFNTEVIESARVRCNQLMDDRMKNSRLYAQSVQTLKDEFDREMGKFTERLRALNGLREMLVGEISALIDPG